MSDEQTGDDDELESPTERPTVDAANPVQLRRRQTSKKLADKDALRFWQVVFDDATGRREMWGLLQASHAFEERFACGPNGFPQVEATWFEAGLQSFGQRLYQTWLVRYPEGVRLMHLENDSRFQKQKDG